MFYRRKLTIFGRSLLLITLELLANVVCWIVAGLLFGRHEQTRGTMSLALLAWTIGLRHALDADHISAIDNATRGLISLGQLPVTCGLFFSLGHSTIVIAVNVAIAISTSVYDKINGVSNVGGIVGTAVSASFLFIIGLANSIILFRIIRNRRRRARAGVDAIEIDERSERSIMMRVIGPVTTFVNKPWKMYPVGVLFGFGFDTASSIALIAISALAKKDSDGKGIAQGDIVILPFLFTVGMTLVDSIDSVLMLYAYAGGPDRTLALFERRGANDDAGKVSNAALQTPGIERTGTEPELQTEKSPLGTVGENKPVLPAEASLHCGQDDSKMETGEKNGLDYAPHDEMRDDGLHQSMRVKQHTMSSLSVALTLISILVAFSISLIEIMGLIGEQCGPCQRAAEAPNGGGLAGRWWRGWAKANDDSGFIGAAIVGGFVLVVAGWYGSRWVMQRVKKTKVERT